jgi:FMN phosphatase YigB (HAD superfamily)
MPDRRLVAGALASVGIEIDPDAVPRAHYAAVRRLDRDHAEGVTGAYPEAFSGALAIDGERLAAAITALSQLADRERSGQVLWSELAPGAIDAINAMRRAGIEVAIVTNSDGHAADNLRDAGILAATGLDASAVIDSVVVGSAKPDRGIFDAALRRTGVEASGAVHIGDMLSTDVAGADAVGITPIHLDPYRLCRAPGHRHVRSLAGIWAHLARPTARS